MDKERGKFLSVFTSAELDVENKHGRTGISLSDPLEDRTKGWSTFSICNKARFVALNFRDLRIDGNLRELRGPNLHPLPTFEPSSKRLWTDLCVPAASASTTPYFHVYFTDFVVSFSRLVYSPPPSLENSAGSRIELILRRSKFLDPWRARNVETW